MKIVEFTAENVKRLRAVDITPAEHVQVVAGRNAQGKTSVLDAIWLALGGGTASKGTARPIRDGEDTARVRLDLGDLVVTRTWTGDKTALKVESADGAKYSSPQGVLDALVGRLSFDPLAFTHLSPRDQVSALLDLVDLPFDPADLDRRRAALFEERTAIGREGKAAEGHLAGLPEVPAGTPDVEVSASSLIGQIRGAQELRREQANDHSEAQGIQANIDRISAEIDRLQASLAEHQIDLDNIQRCIENHRPAPDVTELERRLTMVESTNARVRAKHERAAAAAKVAERRAAYDALTAQIDGLDTAKREGLAAATFPIAGLGFGDTGVTYQGVPFSQASAAEQIRVSLAMAMALNPQLRVIRILDGSLLDADNLALIGDMAREHDYQVWVERVGDGDGIGVVIEDGSVLDTEAVA